MLWIQIYLFFGVAFGLEKKRVLIWPKDSMNSSPSHLKDNYETVNYNDQVELVDPITNEINFDSVFLHQNNPSPVFGEASLVDFAIKGGNILWIIDAKNITAGTKRLAKQFGRIIDNTLPLFEAAEKDPQIISTFAKNKAVCGENPSFQGFGHGLDEANPLVFSILTANKGAYSENDGGTNRLGTENVLVSALQSRADSRITIITGKLLNSLECIIDWTFGKKGIISLTHHQIMLHGPQDRETALEMAKGQEFVMKMGQKLQVKACLKLDNKPLLVDDLQLEINLMENQIRAPFTRVISASGPTSCLQTDQLTLPPKHGIYTMLIRYQRRGWNHLIIDQKLTILPITDEDFPKFKLSAIPYYFSWITSMLLALLTLSSVI